MIRNSGDRPRYVRAVSAVGMCLVLLPLSASGAVRVRDIPYQSPGGSNTFLDFARPNGGIPPGSPTVIFIHGGNWFGGSKGEYATFRDTTANAGFGVVSCDYTLSTPEQPSFPQVIHDIKAVIRWVRTEGVATYGLSPQIVLTGTSVGSYLAQMAAVTAGHPSFEPLPPPPGGYGVSAVIGFYGPTDLVALAEAGTDNAALEQYLGMPYTPETAAFYAEASTTTYVTPDDPPMAFFHGLGDSLIPPQQSISMNAILRAEGIYALLYLYPNVGHNLGGFGQQAGASQLTTRLIPVLLAGPQKEDHDRDGDVDADDCAFLRSCLSGPNVPLSWLETNCQPADLDGDGDVDQSDFGLLQGCLTGPGAPLSVECVPD